LQHAPQGLLYNKYMKRFELRVDRPLDWSGVANRAKFLSQTERLAKGTHV